MAQPERQALIPSATDVDLYATRAGTVIGASSSIAPAPGTPTVGTVREGRFRVLRSHARGGLGEVFVARDGELNREVALKEIQDRHADHQESRTRFLLEAEITGALEHPGIVPVYGLGSYPDGRPFYAMRFIRGDSLQDAVARFHKADGPERDPAERAIALRGLLRRFIDVCQAIAYAHSRGVIHRDLKPGNVMLGQYGETLVVDWGLAKPLTADATEKPSTAFDQPIHPNSLAGSTPTYAGVAVGTPQYMSPEQAAGRIDELGPATDVYSFGATLYSLLTGKPPLEGSNVLDILERVQRGDIRPPRSVKPSVHPALDAICMKAMAVLPENRYQTPKALAEDIEQWLADEPTTAWREPWIIRARRWANRHRTAVTAGVAAFVVAGVCLGVATVLLTAANRRERAAKQEAQEQRDEAARNYRLARSAVDRYHTEVSEDVLLHEPGMEPLRRRLLESAREFYAQFVALRADDPSVRAEFGHALFRLAQITGDVDSPSQGIELHKQALAVFTELAAAHPDDPEILADQASTLHHLGRLQREVDDLAHSREAYAGALALWARLEKAHPEDNHFPAEEARTRLGLGNVEQVLRLLKSAREEYEKSLAIRAPLATANPHREDYARDLAITRHNLAMVQAVSGSTAEADKNYQLAQSAQEKMSQAAPNVTQYAADVARTHHNRGDLYRQTGQPAEAVQQYSSAASGWGQLADNHPTVHRFRAWQAMAFAGLCLAQRQAHEEKKAEEACKKAQAIYQQIAESAKLLPNDRAEVATGYRVLGDLQRSQGKFADARIAYQRSLDLLEPLTNGPGALPEYVARLARIWNNLGLLARAEKNTAKAQTAFEKAQHLWAGLAGAHPENVDFAAGLSVSRWNLGNLAGQDGRAIAALDFYGQAISALESGRDGRGETAEARAALRDAYRRRAETFAAMNRQSDALPDRERVVELSSGADQLWARMELAMAKGRVGDHVGAATDADSLAAKAKTTKDGEVFFKLGCAYALAAGASGHDAAVPSGERKRLVDTNADKALAQLRKAAAVGYFRIPANREKLEKSPDLADIRDRPGFANLLAN